MTLTCSIILLLAISKVGPTFGLYEDQINKYDWKKEYIGRINDIVYDNTMSVSRNLFVITERNVLASLASKNGQINWRQVSNSDLVKILKYDDGILTISSSGIMRIWDHTSGILRWDLNFGSFAGEDVNFEFVDAAIIELDYAENDLIMVSTTEGVYVVTPGAVQSGAKVKPRASYKKYSSPLQGVGKLYYNSESDEICVIDIIEGSSITSRFFNSRSLEMTAEKVVHTSWLDNLNGMVALESKKFIYASKDMETIYVIDLKKGVESTHYSYSSLGVASSIKSLECLQNYDLSVIGTDFFAILENGDVMHFRIENNNAIKLVTSNSGSKDYQTSLSILKVGNEKFYFISRNSNVNLKVSAFSLISGQENDDMKLDLKLPGNVGTVQKTFINMYLKKTSPMGYRVIILTEDNCMMMATLPTRIAWRREESLSDVTTAEMIDLPLSDIEAGIEIEFEKAEKLSILQMFSNRITVQIGQFKTFTKQLTKAIKEGTLFEKKTKDPLVQDESLTRDPFSLHKMLVLVTNCGKVFGMDSLSGEIIWSFHLPELKGRKMKVFVQRTTAHFPNPPSALLLASDSGKSGSTVVLTFNPITGEKTADMQRISDVIQASLLPVIDSTHIKPLALLDRNLDVHLIPDNPEIRKKVSEMHKHIYMINADVNDGKIVGYWMQRDQRALETFIITIPKDQEILVVKSKDFAEKINSVGRPLADRSVIYKYLNPNLIFVMTGSKGQPDQTSSLTMYLIDGVTGKIVYYATHKKASGPVHAVHSENWVVYSFWNTKARRTEIASYELYEGKERRNGTDFSSYDDLPDVPQVLSQAYILHGIVTAMGVSKTEKGLTTRQILIALGQGSIAGLPRRFFDPRRPIKPRLSDREEGLIPYMPEIQINPLSLITYNKTIPEISNIYTCPSALESTSIVLVTGLDLFFTRTQPSNMFDVLKEDFEYLLIIAVVAGMFLAAVATRKLAQNKKLNKAWR